MAKGLKDWEISICGLNCGKCPLYEASHGNDKLRNEIAEHVGGKPENIVCEGCRSEPLTHESHWSPDCRMLSCAKEKGFEFCFECGDFPCETLNKFSSDGVPHHARTLENLKEMKEIGVEAWLDKQRSAGNPKFCP